MERLTTEDICKAVREFAEGRCPQDKQIIMSMTEYKFLFQAVCRLGEVEAENEKIKSGVEKLREKWIGVRETEVKLLLVIENPDHINEPVTVGTRARQFAAEEIIDDLAALCGKEEKLCMTRDLDWGML